MTIRDRPDLRELNINNPDYYQRHGYPHEAWRRLRAEAPVYWYEGRDATPGFWAITKYEDIVRISRDPLTFSSRDHSLSTAQAAQQRTDGRPEDRGARGDLMMLSADPPRHVRLRRLVNKGFTPRQIAALEPHVRALVRGILDDVAPRGECDFVEDIAARLPLAVICEMMGLPREDWQRIYELTNRTVGAQDPEYQQTQMGSGDTGMRAWVEITRYFAGLVAQRRRSERGEDLVSVLVDAEMDGEKLSDDELLAFCNLLIIAGNETTRNATSGGMLALIEHPDQRARLLADPALIPTAVEEILRWVTPVVHFARVATRDTEVRGQPIRAGEKVVMWYPSANRDEEVFADPFTFDVGREPNDHLAFGIGEHFCLGASLARLELRVMFEELLARLPDIEPAGPVQRLRSNFIGGIKHMPVRYTPR
jgi:cytochrome P450